MASPKSMKHIPAVFELKSGHLHKRTAHKTDRTRQVRLSGYCGLAMKFEDWPEEWQEWAKLTPLERFRESEKIFAQYLAMGGSLDPDPDPTSPFYDSETSGSGAAYGRPGLRVLRRSAV